MTINTMNSKRLVSGRLIPNAGIADDFAKPIENLIGLLARDIKRELLIVFSDVAFDGSFNHAMDAGTIVPQVRFRLNALLDKWQKRFNLVARKITGRMITRTVKNSEITLKMSLREISKSFEVDMGTPSAALKTVIQASTEEAANLIKLIPQKYLADVQGAVMRSITTGNGLQDLVPFLKDKYKGNINHARNVAIDQTRKAYSSITAQRGKDLGAESFIWCHHSSRHPRKLHEELNGKEFRFDDPPYIGDMYGQRIYGLVGVLPFCRCTMRLQFEWMK
jgi:SPP1 gp7 family putative phage head morphogenesis protein